MAQYPNMGAENSNFLRLLKTMIVGALWLFDDFDFFFCKFKIQNFEKKIKNRNRQITTKLII